MKIKKESIDNIPEENKHGDCYVVAATNLINEGNNNNIKLVHGIVTGQGPINGIKYGHAWLEDDEYVYDYTQKPAYQVLPKSIYYNLGKIKYTVKYDYYDALKQLVETENYGPWDKKILQLKY